MCNSVGIDLDFYKDLIIEFKNAQGNFVCPNHFSEFSTSGAVTKGPATSNLKKYNIAITGNTLTVTA